MKLIPEYSWQDFELYKITRYMICVFETDILNQEYYIIYNNDNKLAGVFITKAGFEQIWFLKTQKMQQQAIKHCIKIIFEEGNGSVEFRFIKEIYES